MNLDAAREAMEVAGIWPMVDATLTVERFTLADLLGKARTPQRLSRMRHRLWTMAYDMRDVAEKRRFSYPDLGKLFNRDHTSIISGVAEHRRTRPLPKKRKMSKRTTETLRKLRVAMNALAEAEQALLR